MPGKAHGENYTQVYARVPKTLVEEIDRRAEAMRMSRAGYLGVVLEQAMESPLPKVAEWLGRGMAKVRRGRGKRVRGSKEGK